MFTVPLIAAHSGAVNHRASTQCEIGLNRWTCECVSGGILPNKAREFTATANERKEMECKKKRERERHKESKVNSLIELSI